MSKKYSDTEHINLRSSRREFILQTLKMTAGAYVAMSVIDSFVGPKMGVGGMPLNAATTTVGTKPPHDIPPHDLPPEVKKKLKLKFKELPEEKKKNILEKIKKRKKK